MGLLAFFFGKSPKIFDENGDVRHDLGAAKWKRWNDRFAANPELDWRLRKGTPPVKRTERVNK